jgi:hypothetical protein
MDRKPHAGIDPRIGDLREAHVGNGHDDQGGQCTEHEAGKALKKGLLPTRW